ncbi:MAG: LysM peptidoglycan-binding domain-containing protein [Sulfurovaceae bacterium]|nr:LysM peptidoglycan-binding domain-containing protein [Sulfurovaceae bacterium]
MYYQKASKDINSDYYNTYTGRVNRAKGKKIGKRGELKRGDILSTIIKILAIVFLLTLMIFGYIFVSNQYYLSHSSEKPFNKVVGVNTIESVATIINEKEQQLSSADVTQIVQMVMLKMSTLNEEQLSKSNILPSLDTQSTIIKNESEEKNKNKKIIINQESLQSKSIKFIVVKKGDTLSTIASRVYGDKTAYTKIRHANGEAIEDSNKIIAGQRLRIPL